MYATLTALRADKKCLSSFENNEFIHVNFFRIISNCLSEEKNEILPFKILYNNLHNLYDPPKILFLKDLNKIIK